MNTTTASLREGSTYQLTFDQLGGISGQGHDQDGCAGIIGRWSGDGNVVMWMERLERINTFCEGIYERTEEGNIVIKGSFVSSTGVCGKFMASAPPPNMLPPPPPGSAGAPALAHRPDGYATTQGLYRSLSRAVSRARGTGPYAPKPAAPASQAAVRPTLEKSRSMKELSDQLPDGWEACRNYANNMVYYIDHNTKTTTYIRPPGGPGQKLPYVGMPAGGNPAAMV